MAKVGSTSSTTSGTSIGTSGTYVTVIGVAVSPGTVTLDPPSSGGTAGNLPTTAQLAATVTFSNGSTNQQVTWSSAAGAVSVSSGGLVTVTEGVAPQTVAVTATSVANPGYSAHCNVVIQNDGVVGVTVQ